MGFDAVIYVLAFGSAFMAVQSALGFGRITDVAVGRWEGVAYGWSRDGGDVIVEENVAAGGGARTVKRWKRSADQPKIAPSPKKETGLSLW